MAVYFEGSGFITGIGDRNELGFTEKNRVGYLVKFQLLLFKDFKKIVVGHICPEPTFRINVSRLFV